MGGVSGRSGSRSRSRRFSRLQQLDPVSERLAGHVGGRSRHLDHRQLERQPRVATVTLVLHRQPEQVDQTDDGGLGQLLRLPAETLLRLLGERERIGHVADVLDEQHLPEMLEELVDERTEIVALLRERVERRQRARRVPVDDHVAQPVERLLLDRSAELEDGLHGDVTVGRGSELIEGRRRVAERAAGAACDQREGGVRRLDVLTVGDPPQVRCRARSAGAA